MATAGAGLRPTGVVTFVFTDVVASTSLWAEDPEGMAASLELHDSILRETFDSAGGYVFTTAGDSFSVAFQDPAAAVAAARAVQGRLAGTVWPGPSLEVRIGAHLSTAVERDGDYFGPAVNTAARIEAAGHGGQILLSDAVVAVVEVDTVDLGSHHLRGVGEAVWIHQVGDRAHPPLRVASDAVVRLPAPTSSLLGRDEEVQHVRTRLHERRLVTLTGVGGTGKTRLAIEVADREIPRFPAGVWFADLAVVEDPDDVDAHVARSIGLTVGDDEIALDRIWGLMSDRRALLVLDNCEHVIDAAADLVESILAQRGESRVLATSREALDVDGEAIFQVPSLAVESDQGTTGPAVRLFIERSHDAGVELDTDPVTQQSIVELCAQLDGMPLAIELAAARTTSLPPAQLLERLNDRFALLGRRRRGRGRQRTLEATVDWSYRLLDEDEQRFFRLCGVFSGMFDVGGVAAVAGMTEAEALEVIDSLVAKSLVTTTRRTHLSPVVGQARYRLLETLRAFAQDKLIDRDEMNEARDAHAAFFAERYDVLGDAWMSTHLLGYDDHESLVSAYEHAAGRDETDLARRLLAGVCGNAARWPPLPPAGRFFDDPLIDPTTPYGRNALRAIGTDSLQKGDLPMVSRVIGRLDDVGGVALLSSRMLEVFLAGRWDQERSQAALAEIDAADLSELLPVEASRLRLYRAYGHWLHGDADWMRSELSLGKRDWVPLADPMASSLVGALDVLDGRTRDYRPAGWTRLGRSFLRTLDLVLSGNRAELMSDVAGVRAALTQDPSSGAAFPMLCSNVVLAWVYDDHDLTRRMLVSAGASAAPWAGITLHLGRLLGCEDEMLRERPTPGFMRNIGRVVLDHIDEVENLVDRATRTR